MKGGNESSAAEVPDPKESTSVSLAAVRPTDLPNGKEGTISPTPPPVEKKSVSPKKNKLPDIPSGITSSRKKTGLRDIARVLQDSKALRVKEKRNETKSPTKQKVLYEHSYGGDVCEKIAKLGLSENREKTFSPLGSYKYEEEDDEVKRRMTPNATK